MTLQGLLTALGNIAINDRMVSWAGAGSSVYSINDLTIRDYPIFFASPTGTHRVEENWTTYQLTLFFIDRLLEDNSNDMDIQSTAIEVLKNLIKKAAQQDGIVSVGDEYTITLFVDTEKFKDRCSGAYATVEFSIENDSTCVIYSNEIRKEPFTDPNQTIHDYPAEGQIFYKTVSGVVREDALYLNAKDPDGNDIHIISNTYPDPEGYGIIQYDGPLYQGWPFFPSQMLEGNSPGTLAQAVTEVILPEGYGVLANYDHSIWGIYDNYLKSVYIPSTVTKMYPTDCITQNVCSLENVIIPANVQGGLDYHSMTTIEQQLRPTPCQGLPRIYYNNTIENWHKMSPHDTYWQMANTGALIHCLDGDTYQK